MKIEITTRNLLHMMKDAYRKGIAEANSGAYTDNPEGRPEIVAQELLMKKMWDNDYIIQQS